MILGNSFSFLALRFKPRSWPLPPARAPAPVQGQVEAPAAAAAASRGPAAGSGPSVVVVVGMMGCSLSHRQGRHERLGFASRRRHLLPGPPPRRAAPAGGESPAVPPTPGTGDGSPGAKSPRRSAERCRREGRRSVAGARNREPRKAEAAVAARSRRFPVPGKLRTAAAAAAAAAGQRACVSSRPCALLPAALPPPAARSLLRLPAEPSVQPRACLRRPGRRPRLLPRAGAGLPCTRLGLDAGDHGVGERLSILRIIRIL